MVEDDVGGGVGAVGDGAGAVVVALPVGAEEDGADSRLGALVVKLRVCGGGLALGVQAVTPRPKTAGARNITMWRANELLMIDPSGVSGKP
jgi:hypothetical protein